MADFIQSYLNKKSLTTSTIKGKTLFQGGTVKLIDLNMEDEVATFVVQGSRLYYVYIYDFQSKKISSECNCAYDWGGICKHEIASLIFLEQRLGHSKKIGSTPRKSSKTHISRNTSTPYLMPDYLPLNEVDLEFHIDVNELRKLSYSSSVELAAYEDDTLTYDVVISEFSFRVKFIHQLLKIT